MSTSKNILTNGNNYVEEIEAWRKKRDEDLRVPDGWLALTNLFILSEGSFTLGSDADNAIVLPTSAPGRLGVLDFKNNAATLRVSTDVPVLFNGVTAREFTLEDNTNRKPTLVTVGTIILFIHHFAEQYAVRVKDTSHPGPQAFAGNDWFPANPAYRVQGKFTRFDQVQAVPIDTIWHFPSEYKAVGAIDFELHGQAFSLLAADHGVPGHLWVSFRDETSSKQTYGPVRFVQADLTADGTVNLDFNKTVNPPCAFTPFATCPLAPKQNVLPVAIEAGELYGPAVIDIYNSFAAQAHLLPA